jgi:hypothetical protein
MSDRLNQFRRFMLRHTLVLRAWRAVLTMFGRIIVPFASPRLTEDQISECYRRVYFESGALLGVYSRRFATGLCLPKGQWHVEHSAWYIGYGQVLEAITPRVRIIPLRQFLQSYDRVVIGYVDLPRAPASFARAMDFNGRPYDVLFGGGRRWVYCHEAAAEIMRAGGEWPRKSGEFWTFDDLAAACLKVEVIE